jgi:hypothetical protein
MSEGGRRDPILEGLAARRQALIEAHAAVRSSERYKASISRIDRISQDFIETLRLAWFFAQRDPKSSDMVFWRFTDDLMASGVAIWQMVTDGIDSIARRELRFMLELAIRNVYVDRVLASPETPLETRMALIDRKVEGDVNLLKDLPINTYWSDPRPFEKEVRNRLYGSLSAYVHPSHDQLQRRLELADRGVFLGFETADEISDFADLLLRVYDVVLVLVFLALGPSSTGDLFTLHADPDPEWSFWQSRFVPEVSTHFDYKVERKAKLDR